MWSVKRKLGEFYGSQIIYNGKSLLNRIPTDCDQANESYYEVWKEGSYFIVIVNPRYTLFCKHCGERLELDFEEFQVLKHFIKLNKKLEDSKIDIDEHFIGLTKLQKRFK